MLEATNINDAIMLKTDNAVNNLKLFNPTIMLQGHSGEIFTGKFSNEGILYASGGHDKNVMIWETFEEKCRNLVTLQGHTNAIIQLQWNHDDSRIYTCSADKTVCIWDLYAGKRIKKLKGHENIVNSIDSSKKGQDMIISCGDDNQVILWDTRTKTPSFTEKFKFQLTSVVFSHNNDQIYIGGIDNVVKIYDLRKKQVENMLIGHTDTITGLTLSNDGNFLLSNSMDHTIRCWDVRPFVNQTNRCTKIFQGATHNFEKNLLRVCINSDDSLISAGSADRFVYIWNFATTKIERKFGGHNGSVNETSFNKISNIISSCSSDQTIIIGEF